MNLNSLHVLKALHQHSSLLTCSFLRAFQPIHQTPSETHKCKYHTGFLKHTMLIPEA